MTVIACVAAPSVHWHTVNLHHQKLQTGQLGQAPLATPPRPPPSERRAFGTYGLSGSAKTSSQSSILLVCSRILSNGLESVEPSALPGPPKGLCAARL